MASKRLPWFRMYTDFLNDPKLISLAFEDQRHFIGILALKCDGAIDEVGDPDLLDRIVAQRLWIDHAVIRDVKKRLMTAGLIDAKWQPLAWEKRQARSDIDSTGAERQRRFRESQQRNALRNGDVTRLELDIDKEKEREEGKKQPRAVALSRPDDVTEQTWADWLQLRKTKKAPVTQTVLNGAKREAAKAGIALETFLQIWCVRGSQGMQAEWITANDLKQAGAQPQQSSVGRFV